MTPEELEQAISQFEANGGKIEVVVGCSGHAPSPEKEDKPPREYPEALVERLRGFEDLGVCAAAKSLRMKPETLNRIAKQYGIMFSTNTAANVSDRWADREKMVPRIREMSRKGLSQAKICRELGITRIVLRGIAKRHGININSRAK